MLYSEESDVWMPESKEFCLMCLKVGGGDLSLSKSMMLHEQGKDSGPLLLWPPPGLPIILWWELSSCRLLLLPEEPTKTRCHKLLLDVCGKWKPRVKVAEDPASSREISFRFFCCLLSADCDRLDLRWFDEFSSDNDDAVTTRFSWIRSNVLESGLNIAWQRLSPRRNDEAPCKLTGRGKFQNGSTMASSATMMMMGIQIFTPVVFAAFCACGARSVGTLLKVAHAIQSFNQVEWPLAADAEWPFL